MPLKDKQKPVEEEEETPSESLQTAIEDLRRDTKDITESAARLMDNVTNFPVLKRLRLRRILRKRLLG